MEVVNLRVSQIEPDRNQPRKYFDQNALIDLSTSIAENGIIEPIIVKPLSNGFYRIIAGERRWRASRMANLSEIPTIVMEDISELDAFKLSFNENLQRQNLTPIEEALGYVRLQQDFNLTQIEISKVTGRSRPSIANTIRLLKLSEPIQDMISSGDLSVAHAKLILSTEERHHMALAKMVINEGLSIKQLAFEIKKLQSIPRQQHTKGCNRYFKEIEISLCNAINRPVKVSGTEKNGTLSISFYGNDDLSTIANAISKILEDV